MLTYCNVPTECCMLFILTSLAEIYYGNIIQTYYFAFCVIFYSEYTLRMKNLWKIVIILYSISFHFKRKREEETRMQTERKRDKGGGGNVWLRIFLFLLTSPSLKQR